MRIIIIMISLVFLGLPVRAFESEYDVKSIEKEYSNTFGIVFDIVEEVNGIAETVRPYFMPVEKKETLRNSVAAVISELEKYKQDALKKMNLTVKIVSERPDAPWPAAGMQTRVNGRCVIYVSNYNDYRKDVTAEDYFPDYYLDEYIKNTVHHEIFHCMDTTNDKKAWTLKYGFSESSIESHGDYYGESDTYRFGGEDRAHLYAGIVLNDNDSYLKMYFSTQHMREQEDEITAYIKDLINPLAFEPFDRMEVDVTTLPEKERNPFTHLLDTSDMDFVEYVWPEVNQKFYENDKLYHYFFKPSSIQLRYQVWIEGNERVMKRRRNVERLIHDKRKKGYLLIFREADTTLGFPRYHYFVEIE